ncbi:ACT domain-containing protein [Nocardiopsis sp. NRRL B-16309]|uniref:ACT domain-containing protein n=1 Tax=Nocardiopsis sp. NRRL B-16309 TaxID=1519494 RepID=UPI0006AD8665|nr:ACT domain-containing protein [Nocardiopsis sp. NRRL B-16309]KOX08804.1 amino acid-binding protein [Nocardiopsis sp. NRRL B-16309]
MDASEGDYGTDDHTRPGFLGREALDLGILLLAAGAAHVVVLSLGHSDGGVGVLIAVGVLLLAVSGMHRWHRQRAAHAARRRLRRGGPTGPTGSTAPVDPLPAPLHDHADDRLWSVRVTVADVPGGLAALTSRFAALGVDIRLMQVHPGGPEAIDEFFVNAPARVDEGDLYSAVQGAGVRDVIVRPADVHELSDTTSRTLALVSALITGATTLERSLMALSAAQDVQLLARAPEGMGREDLSGTTMTLPAPGGGVLVVRREGGAAPSAGGGGRRGGPPRHGDPAGGGGRRVGVPFTALEFARCRALVHVALSLRADARR